MSAPITTKKTTKLTIPHNIGQGVNIVGVLEQLEPERETRGRKIALVLHGTMGHKDYLFQKRVALRLPLDSFRFDFRGNHESGGTWKQAAIHEDVEDVRLVVSYLTENYGYEVDLVVGHSRGSVVGMSWCCTSGEGKKVSGFVNASGRYRMERIKDNLRHYAASFLEHGHYKWHVTVARKPVVGIIYPGDLDQFASWDTSIVWDQFPGQTDVLTVHGSKDATVPPYDATLYARAFGSREQSGRGQGTHNLCFIEGGDHNFTGIQDEITDIIIRWWAMHERKELKSGIWETGVKPEPVAVVTATSHKL